MLFNASIFVGTKDRSYLFGLIKLKPNFQQLSQFVIDGEDDNDGERKLANKVEQYKKIDPQFFSNKIIKTFLLPIK
jgi:mevalonate pyrophosphate decarboxylase